MSSKTAIVNMALGRIGASKQINNIESDTSREAINARTFIDSQIGFVLRDFPWPFATAYATLALVGGSATVNVNGDWRYSYRYPTDCKFARRLVVASAGGRNNVAPPPFRIGKDSQGKLIYTDEADAVLEYTASVDDVEEFDDMAVSMLAWRIGGDLAPASSRIKGVMETCVQMYEVDKAKAQSRALNEGQQQTPVESEFIRDRD